MRPSTLLLLITAAIASLTIVWTQHRQEQAELRLRVLKARLEPLGQLDYQDLRSFPWGHGSVRELSLTLSAAAAERLGLNVGTRLRAERVELIDWRERDAQTPELLRLRWQSLHWPLPAASDSPALHLSQLRELGLRELQLDGELQIQYLPDDRVMRVQLEVQDPGLAAISSELSLRGGPELFLGRFETLELSRARFDYRDLGLLAQLRQAPQLPSLVDNLDPDSNLVARFDRGSAEYGLHWSAENYRQLQAFLHQPLALRVQLDPPGRLELRNLDLYARADLPEVLGLEVSPPPATP